MFFPLSRVVQINSSWDMSHNCRKIPGTIYFKFVHSMLSKIHERPLDDTSKTRTGYIKLNILHHSVYLLRGNVGSYYRAVTLFGQCKHFCTDVINLTWKTRHLKIHETFFYLVRISRLQAITWSYRLAPYGRDKLLGGNMLKIYLYEIAFSLLKRRLGAMKLGSAVMKLVHSY